MIKINNHIIYIFWLIYFYYLFPFGHRTPGEVFCIFSKSGLEFFFYSDHFWYVGKIVHVDTKYDRYMKKKYPLFDKDLKQNTCVWQQFLSNGYLVIQERFFAFVRKCGPQHRP